MKVTITYKDSQQISPDSFDTFTRVIFIEPEWDMKKVYEEATKSWNIKGGDFHGEIHFTF